ncbi:MAG: DUF4147 domain-containing protein [Burkholderiales bacterium]|nr:DUF4147 domain-containing protein [Burkholderiales bacterium]
MEKHWIKNFDKLAITENRKMALEIIEAGLDAINTEKVIESSISMMGNTLVIKGKSFNLSKYKNIKIVGFGKSSCDAALALENILGDKIKEGAVVGLHKIDCKYIETFEGTHPRPSEKNIEAGQRIYDIANDAGEDDLIIAIISGGGSALLCYPETEYKEGAKLYESFLKTGKTISEMNTVRKHLSLLKGGGLAKVAYPATVVGLIFSDVPGDLFSDVASGPTYKDNTTLADAKQIIINNKLGEFILNETPKDDKYFEKVYNFVLVSNKTAAKKMAEKAEEFNFDVNVVSTDLYYEINKSLEKIFLCKKENSVILAAGESRVVVEKSGGKGGRNLHTALLAVKNKIADSEHSVFISFASDGMDNSDAAGAVVDKYTLEKIKNLGIDINDHLERFDSYPVFEKTGDIIITGPTGANVSDLMILLTKK